MNRQTHRLLKVYLRLGWLKLHAYYEKLTSIAYAGAIVMNPYRKHQFLTRLWQQVPEPQATSYFNECKTRLRALWEKHCKDRDFEGEIAQPSLVDVTNYREYTSLRMQYRNSLGDDDKLRNTSRRRQPRAATQAEDELDKYLSEPPVPEDLYNGDSMAWRREVGSRRFPKLSFLAADFLSIPPSVGTTERQFNNTGSMITPRRTRLRPHIVNQAQCLSNWRRSGVYVATERWQRIITVATD
jgi:hypothetical protein